MKRPPLPFQPIRNDLYPPEELMRGYEPGDPLSVKQMADFLIFKYLVENGRSAAPADALASMMEALHDNSILQAMNQFLEGRQRIAAIMGGHGELRGTKTYRNVVDIARRLSQEGFLMASGGGPGLMEATHLGALLQGAGKPVIEEAIGLLADCPELPPNDLLVESDNPNGPTVIAFNDATAKKLHAWMLPAHRLLQQLKQQGIELGKSLAVPTWQYGHEPFSPLATHVAKYFQNSIREDVLLALATQGIVFAPGKAGTLQEIFQDAAQNYYPAKGASFAPMVFFDTDYWRNKLPVEGLLKALFAKRLAEYERKVLFTDDIEEVVDFLTQNAPPIEAVRKRMAALGVTADPQA